MILAVISLQFVSPPSSERDPFIEYPSGAAGWVYTWNHASSQPSQDDLPTTKLYFVTYGGGYDEILSSEYNA